ncbi:polymorphic toxin-type HINT domain-containing protein [Nocardiopsis oceani]
MEYAAVIVLVAAVAASLFLVGLPRLISDGVGDAVGDALGAGESISEDAPGAEPGGSGTLEEEPGEEPGEVGSADQGSQDSTEPGDPIDVDPAPYDPEEHEGTVGTAFFDGDTDYVTQEAWSLADEWERHKDRGFWGIGIDEDGRLECGVWAFVQCTAYNGVAQGIGEAADSLEELGCHLHFCGSERFAESWSDTWEGATNLWNDPMGTLGGMWGSLTDPFVENFEEHGFFGGLGHNLGYGATMFGGAYLKPLRLLGDSGRSSQGNNDDRRGRDDCHNSFVPGTLVLLADGTAKPIELVAVGDRVLAHDLETGKEGEREVTHLISGGGEKTLVEVEVDDGSGEPGTVTATDNHPFWVPDQGWTDAIDLEPGSWLQTSSGVWMQVSAVDVQARLHQPVHNITVQDLQTYYVLAGETPVLVHNSGDCDWSPHHENAGDLASKYSEGQSTRDPASQWYHEELSNDELLDSINNAAEGDGIAVSPGGTILGGHHRWDELQARIDDGRIDPNTSIRIDVFGED